MQPTYFEAKEAVSHCLLLQHCHSYKVLIDRNYVEFLDVEFLDVELWRLKGRIRDDPAAIQNLGCG